MGRPVRSARRQSGRRPAGRGFTLAELIVATTVTVLLSGATVGVIRGVAGARLRVQRQDALQAEARAAVETIAVALRNAHRTPGDPCLLQGTDGWRGDLPNDRIRFFTVTDHPVRPGTPESDVVECEFRLSQPGKKAPQKQWHHRITGGRAVLLRRLDPTRNKAPDQGGVVELIAREVVAMDFTYYDGVEWRPEWSQKDKSWPLAVRISVAVRTKDEPRKVWTATRTVNFPRRPEAEEGKEAP